MMRTEKWLHGLLLGAILFASGCSTWTKPQYGKVITRTPPQQSLAQQHWAVRQQELGGMSRWTMQARAASGSGFGLKGSLRWRQTGDVFDIRVRGPFGIGAARLDGTPRRVRIRSGDQDWVTTQPQLAMRQNLGWSLPLGGLQSWALGLPASEREAGRASYNLDAVGRITELRQGPWTVRYTEYAGPDRLALPRKINAEHQDGTKLSLIVDAWSDLG